MLVSRFPWQRGFSLEDIIGSSSQLNDGGLPSGASRASGFMTNF